MNRKLDRVQYATRLLIVYLTYFIILFYVNPSIDFLFPDKSGFKGLILLGNIFVIFSLLTLACLVCTAYFASKRLNDMNVSGWWGVVTIIPIVGQIFSIALIVPAGTKGENKYGV
jgi:uncharacterized membrane protein YhaH (DUF805 family)